MQQMTPERWQRVTALLEKVLPCEPGERETLLRDLCDGDEALRREVESLLRYEEVDVGLLGSPVVPGRRERRQAQATTASFPAGEGSTERGEVGLRIGPYRVLDRLGAGGMGDVFLAAREDDFRKKVALKRIQRRKLSDELRHRFENERQILADLEHPNIARILDGGTTEDGLPYFAMELVEGQPIDRYCDEKRLTIRERLRLFLAVCSALQLAHQNLVVHRDLKPGNVLVTREGVPKLLDFGIAKNLGSGSAAHAVATRVGSQPMTLKYASPEQLQEQPITTAADVYSLGVLLFQLLTGHDPFPCDQGQLELYRAICERPPPKPSDAVAQTVAVRSSEGQHDELRTPETVSAARGTDPGALRRSLAGDLDSIVLKALRKRPENRYRSVERLGDDLRRHLDGRPVSARESTFPYLAGKFVRRHWLALAVAGAVLSILTVSGLAVMRAEQARALAAEREVRLLKDLLQVFAPDLLGSKATPLELLNRLEQKITAELRSEPEILADLLGSSAAVYRELGHYEEALAALDEALTILRVLHPGDHAAIAEVIHKHGGVLYRMGDYQGAEARWREVLAMRRRLGLEEVELVSPLTNLATSLAHRGELDGAAERYRQILEIQRRLVGADDPSLAITLRNLGWVSFLDGRQEEAESRLRQALELELAAAGPESVDVAALRSALGKVLQSQGRLQEAEEQLVKALELRRLRLEADHVDLARSERNLAAVLLQAGEPRTAEVLLTRAQAALRRRKPAGDWEIAELESLLGASMAAEGRYEAAESCLVESYCALEAARGTDVIFTRQALDRVMDLYETWGKPQRTIDCGAAPVSGQK